MPRSGRIFLSVSAVAARNVRSVAVVDLCTARGKAVSADSGSRRRKRQLRRDATHVTRVLCVFDSIPRVDRKQNFPVSYLVSRPVASTGYTYVGSPRNEFPYHPLAEILRAAKTKPNRDSWAPRVGCPVRIETSGAANWDQRQTLSSRSFLPARRTSRREPSPSGFSAWLAP